MEAPTCLCVVLSSSASRLVEVERTKHLYQADEFFGLGIKGVAGAWRLAELIDVGRSQRLHDQPALVLIDFDVVAHLILLNAAGPDRCQLSAKELLGHWQTEQVTGQMATWREWRAWRREFKSLGIRQVKEREARSIWHQEKQQAARWWLRKQELLPYVITALATLIVGLIAWLR